MRKKKIILCIIIIVIQFSNIVYSHSGRTDGNGGHYNRSTGEYHYHHGMSAHQHPNGICPYDDNEERTSLIINEEDDDDNVKKSKINSIETTKNVDDTPLWKKIMRVFVGLWWFIIPLILGTYDYIKNKYFDKSKNTISIVKNTDIKKEVEVENKESFNVKKETNIYTCPRCGGRLIIKNGRYGRFIGCSNYPRCKYTKSLRNKN